MTTAAEGDRAAAVLERLRRRLAGEGLHIVLPLDVASFDGASVVAGTPRLADLMPGARGAVLVGDGGGELFARFRAAQPVKGARLAVDAASAVHPLDSFTRARVRAAAGDVLEPAAIQFSLFFPFVGERTHLPFQRLGEAAGLPAPGPLGVQVHPTYGPWWAYRALVLVALDLSRERASVLAREGAPALAREGEPALAREGAPALAREGEPALEREGERALVGSCAACDQPCVNACLEHSPAHVARPGSAAGRGGHAAAATRGACSDACGARLRCPFGAEHRYSDEQIAFHARARADA